MTFKPAKLLAWLAHACLLATASASHASLYPSEAPPQHRAARSAPGDTTPMTVVPSSDTVNGQGWYWVPIDGAKCRHNTNTGVAVRFRPDSDKIMITMQGGGACFSSLSCAVNYSEFGIPEFQVLTGSASPIKPKVFEGIWTPSSPFHEGIAPAPNLEHPNNIADEYTHVFIPYCSGDFHAGARQDVVIPWVFRKQNFQGAKNSDLYFHYVIDQLLPLHRQSQFEVVLTGFSAGGHGAALNAERLRKMLPANANMTLLIDSAPPFEQTTSTPIPSSHISKNDTIGLASQTLFRACSQQRMHDTWGLANSVIPACGSACSAGNWMNPVFDKLLKDQPDVFVGLISPVYDSVERFFMSALFDKNCVWDPTQVQYTEGLLKLRAQMQARRAGRGNVATYYISSDPVKHVTITAQRFFELTQLTADAPNQPAVRLQDWFEDMIYRPVSGPPTSPVHVGP